MSSRIFNPGDIVKVNEEFSRGHYGDTFVWRPKQLKMKGQLFKVNNGVSSNAVYIGGFYFNKEMLTIVQRGDIPQEQRTMSLYGIIN